LGGGKPNLQKRHSFAKTEEKNRFGSKLGEITPNWDLFVTCVSPVEVKYHMDNAHLVSKLTCSQLPMLATAVVKQMVSIVQQ